MPNFLLERKHRKISQQSRRNISKTGLMKPKFCKNKYMDSLKHISLILYNISFIYFLKANPSTADSINFCFSNNRMNHVHTHTIPAILLSVVPPHFGDAAAATIRELRQISKFYFVFFLTFLLYTLVVTPAVASTFSTQAQVDSDVEISAGTYTVGAACGPNGATSPAAPAASGQNLICTSGTWQLAQVTDTLWGVNGSSVYYTGGNVGIGTAAPVYSLQVRNGSTADLQFRPTTYGSTGGSLIQSANDANNSAEPLELGASSFAFMGGGSVGIGTTSPVAQLTVGNTGVSVNPPATVMFYDGTALGSALDSMQYVAEIEGVTGNTGRLMFLQHRTSTTTSSWTTGAWRIQPAVDGSFTGVNSNRGFIELAYGDQGSYQGIGLSGQGNTTPDLVVNNSGNVGIGTTNPGYTLQVNGSVAGTSAYNNTSDARLKKDVAEISGGLDMIEKLRGVRFHWRTVEERAVGKKLNLPVDESQIGFIAQDVLKVLPEAVTHGTDGIYTMQESKIVPILVEAVKEQQAQIEADQKEAADLAAQLAALQSQVAKLASTHAH